MNFEWVALGLGNPKERYGGTRHNVGSEAVEWLISGLGGGCWWVRGKHFLGKASGRVLYAVQRCYMNESLLIVEELEQLGIQVSQWCVVHDELALPVGRLRISRGGGAAGHRGVEALAWGLKSDAFSRVRIGVGPSSELDRSRMRDFVLSPFTEAEMPAVQRVVQAAAGAALHVLGDGVDRAMDRFNGWTVPSGEAIS